MRCCSEHVEKYFKSNYSISLAPLAPLSALVQGKHTGLPTRVRFNPLGLINNWLRWLTLSILMCNMTGKIDKVESRCVLSVPFYFFSVNLPRSFYKFSQVTQRVY